ncbi:hypothetical protein TVAG_441540 [Trichomonas vaginalis G3]|uniref:Transmembrane protein n=1 Tax=Trichomonas vaginalis (strain ATCC PRA-98 / G3) TaxID=412133 RepID=A2FL79_TRIV3|nr:hypothetical protein TVAGG3_0569580 [Trichomonas vaginalis G3]EAX94335.1 hypothetical protein TVAG_441540 [Trichomonas vaginalis G3]KAI5521818.1 hypothetical protein TVAGG3_0569580 [Trichomonas vaginalis G3]|eukprot:XP_001307265.1 hypothetical protein [Trichomonas vaginalis G3]
MSQSSSRTSTPSSRQMTPNTPHGRYNSRFHLGIFKKIYYMITFIAISIILSYLFQIFNYVDKKYKLNTKPIPKEAQPFAYFINNLAKDIGNKVLEIHLPRIAYFSFIAFAFDLLLVLTNNYIMSALGALYFLFDGPLVALFTSNISLCIAFIFSFFILRFIVAYFLSDVGYLAAIYYLIFSIQLMITTLFIRPDMVIPLLICFVIVVQKKYTVEASFFSTRAFLESIKSIFGIIFIILNFCIGILVIQSKFKLPKCEITLQYKVLFSEFASNEHNLTFVVFFFLGLFGLFISDISRVNSSEIILLLLFFSYLNIVSCVLDFPIFKFKQITIWAVIFAFNSIGRSNFLSVLAVFLFLFTIFFFYSPIQSYLKDSSIPQ